MKMNLKSIMILHQIGGNICKRQIKFRLEIQLQELVQVHLIVILLIITLIMPKKVGNVLAAAALTRLG